MTDPLYVPVLPALQGEFNAVVELDAAAAGVQPLFEILPPARPIRRSSEIDPPPPKAIGVHVSERLEKLLDSWGSRDPVYVDGSSLDLTARVGRSCVYAHMLGHAEAIGLNAVPVTGPSRPPVQQKAAARAAASCGALAVRVNPYDLLTSETDLIRFCSSTGVEPESVDLMIDAGPIYDDVEAATLRLLTLFDAVPEPGRWRRLILLSGSFPDPLYKVVDNNELKHFVRADWLAWLRLRQIGLERLPIYGDYTVLGTDASPSGISGAHSLRFTGPESWAVIRGLPPSERPSRDFIDLARRIRATREWRSYPAGHCPGCDVFDGESTGGGNSTTWICAAIQHHLTTIIGDLTIGAVAA